MTAVRRALVLAFIVTASWPFAAPAVEPAFEAAVSEPVGSESSCVRCHGAEDDEEVQRSVPEWRRSVHAGAGVSCDACHGGDPSRDDADEAKRDEARFLDLPAWREVSAYCGVCHEAVSQAYDAGRFGQAVTSGVPAPTCITCHMIEGHDIGAAGPELIDAHVPLGRCRDCPEVEHAANEIDELRAVRLALETLEDSVQALDRRGYPMRAERETIAELAALHGAELHRFEAATVQAMRSDLQGRLRAMDRAMELLEVETRERRRFGNGVLVVLSFSFAALVWMRRSRHHGASAD